MPSFSLAALTALELAPPELIDVAAACGYDHVGLRLLAAMPGGVAYPLMEDAAALRETIARLDATGVTVADLEVVAMRPETEIAAFSAFFEAGARLRAKHDETSMVAFLICDHCGSVGEIPAAPVAQSLNAAARASGFAPKLSVVEIAGTCAHCQK